MNRIDKQGTERTRTRYQRISGFYDLMEVLPERIYQSWREKLWSFVEGPRILEVGVGTGKNMPYYPSGTQVTAIDLTPGMLAQARKSADELNLDVELLLGDVQSLEFNDDIFDSVVASFVFCSVPDPLLGLKEMARVTKSNGKILMMDHVRSQNRLLGSIMDLLNPVVVRMIGANINRRTVENVRKTGLQIIHLEDLGAGGIFKLINAQPGDAR